MYTILTAIKRLATIPELETFLNGDIGGSADDYSMTVQLDDIKIVAPSVWENTQ